MKSAYFHVRRRVFYGQDVSCKLHTKKVCAVQTGQGAVQFGSSRQCALRVVCARLKNRLERQHNVILRCHGKWLCNQPFLEDLVERARYRLSLVGLYCDLGRIVLATSNESRNLSRQFEHVSVKHFFVPGAVCPPPPARGLILCSCFTVAQTLLVLKEASLPTPFFCSHVRSLSLAPRTEVNNLAFGA